MAHMEYDAGTNLSLKRRRMMIYFVEATKKLLQTDGVHGLTIRKIATEAGYNSATLYNYFEDLEHLILFGSVCYLRDYIVSLSNALKPSMSSIDRFRTIYHCFNELAFQTPEIFHNLFWGRHSHMLDEVLNIYYTQLFPEELSGIPAGMHRMMFSGNMRERDSVTMYEMVKDGFIAPDKVDATLDLLVATHQHFIYQAYIEGNNLDIESHKKRFETLFEYLLSAAAPQASTVGAQNIL